ncbi:outer membrane biogenesis protein BamB [Botrimarina colliarenosi]|uniref:Outer membrane biogenesis protein BamB n=1 Tax=Botrimarina colliarenosi TaxID=2528001 RepID=A0A5C6ADM2_9BACT|nr:PQQ-binding-like beta-propeller repeat protein [Botrimarina colliarenosi]TWT98064.1 outer membrane biogenesis protein BamB [Botrimarina colliarenosi]
MATAKQFLEAIELQKLVSNDVLDELYEEYRASGGAVTAEALAKQLQSRGLLSDAKAAALVQAPSESFIQVGSGILNPSRPDPSSSDDPFEEELQAKRAKAGEKRDAAGRRKHVQKSHKNDFDSPLLLLGGGALALLLLGGVGLLVVMSLQSGDQLLDSAQKAYASGSYAQARDEYQQFVEDFEGNARWSEARVKLAVTKLRQLTETSTDWDGALRVAEEEIPQIEDEPAFVDSRGEFASILPRIARGLAEAADRASGAGDAASERIDQLVTDAKSALTLVGNTKYVPKSLRDERDLTEINELLDRVARRREAIADLDTTLETIRTAIAGDDLPAAYAAQAAFVVRRPELRDDPRLAEQLAAAVAAEQEQVRFVEDRAEAATDEPASPVAIALPLANPRRTGQADATGVVTGQFGGVLYGLNATDGTLAWRRPVGERLAETPAVDAGDGLFVIDHRRGEIVRLDTTTGALNWRAEVAGDTAPLHTPVLAGDRVLVATETGRLYAYDSESGGRAGYAQFAQPLRAAPAFDSESKKAYVVGQQSSLYTLDAASLACVGVRYTGHAAGSIVAPPLSIGGRVLVIENTGLETSRLNVFATDESGVVGNQLREWRLEGVVTTPAVVSGRRFLVTTEAGAVYLFEVTSSQDGPPLTLVASQGVQTGPARRRSVIETRGDVWIAGEGLRRTAASLADSQLVARELTDPCEGDLFVGPLEKKGDALFHTRVRKGQPGVTFAASDTRSGELIWETDLAAPPLGPPVFSETARGVVATTTGGETHLIGPQEVRSRQSAKPAATPTRPVVYDASVRLASSDAVFAQVGASQWLAVRVTPRAAARSVGLPGRLACQPTVMGSGVLTPLEMGQVHLLDTAGQPVATPFQPTVAVGADIAWTAPAAAKAGDDLLAVLSDGAKTVYCLGITADALTERGSAALTDAKPVTIAAIGKSRAAIGLAGGSLAVFDLPRLDNPQSTPVGGEIVWGPYAAGDVVLVATSEEVVAVQLADGPQIAWRAPLSEFQPLGEPLIDGDSVVVATRDGVLTRYGLASGDATARLDLGEPIGSGPTVYGPRWLVAAADGTVLVINRP